MKLALLSLNIPHQAALQGFFYHCTSIVYLYPIGKRRLLDNFLDSSSFCGWILMLNAFRMMNSYMEEVEVLLAFLLDRQIFEMTLLITDLQLRSLF